MANTQEVITALEQIQKTNIDSIIISFLIAAVALMLLKIVAEAIAGWVQLRLDQHIAIGSNVEVYGKRGKIKEVSIFTVSVETECGFIRIPTKAWRSSRFITLKGKIPHNRRKEDKGK